MIRVPGDKSIAHRALLLATLAEGESRLRGVPASADLRSTARVLRALGGAVPELPGDGSGIRVPGMGLRGLRSPDGPLDCGNSGTTARLLLGILAGTPVDATLAGDPSLHARPMRRVTEPLARMGARFEELGEAGRLPVRVRGGALESLSWESPVASAQVRSALILAGLVAGAPVTVVQPGRARDHTERMLRRMGAEVREGPGPRTGSWEVGLDRPPERLAPLDLDVPGDFSSAAFLIALGLLRGGTASRDEAEPLRIGGVGLNPTRTGLLAVLERMGARVRAENLRGAADPAGEPVGDLVVVPGPLAAVTVGGDEIPALIDELPVIAVLAARARGTTRIRDAAELRVKESDRIRALAENLGALGVEVEELPDGLRIRGGDRPFRGRVRAHGDHRIAMAFGVLGALPQARVEIDDPEVADVSFPGFWELLGELAPATAEEPSARGPGLRPANRGPSARPPVVTIDGPAGSGKSSTASEVARRLGLRHLDSGALYRALTLAVIESGLPEARWETLDDDDLAPLDLGLVPEANGFRVLLGGRDRGDALRSPEVTARVSRLSAVPAVRRRLLGLQRDAGREGGIVADGRDMGTVVFPDAEVKIFLTARVEERARRRLLQEGRPADPEALAREVGEIRERDARDEGRSVSPLRRPPDAIEVDTTDLGFEEQVGAIVEAVRGAAPGLTGPEQKG